MITKIDEIDKTITLINEALDKERTNSSNLKNNSREEAHLSPKYLLVSDIDGTLLKDGKATPGLRIVKQMLETHVDDVAIVYATGRSFASTHSLVVDGILPRPAAIASFIGTEMWFPDFDQPSPEYAAHLRDGWNRNEVMFWATCMFELELQPEEFQSPYKASFYLKKESKLFDLNAFLEAKRIEARVVYSCGELLDILPKRSGKANAVKYLAEKWKLNPQNILTCGDSGNDLDMLMAKDTCNVAVGNLEEELHSHMDSGRFYTSELPFAAGVLEGATAFGFWPNKTASETFSKAS